MYICVYYTIGTAKEEVERQKQQAVETAQTACDAAKVVYETVSNELLDDFERFKAQKANDIRDILLNFVHIQVTHFYLYIYCILIYICYSVIISRDQRRHGEI